MAFSHGSRAAIFMSGVDLSPYIKSVTPSFSKETSDTSTLGDRDKDYVGLSTDGTVSLEGLYEGADDAIDDVLHAALGSDEATLPNRVLTYCPAGDTVGNPAYCMVALGTSQDVTSPVDDVTQISAEVTAAEGFHRGHVLHASTARSANGNGIALDNAASSADGAVIYLQQIAGSGSASTVYVEDSADNSSWATVHSFILTAANAPTSFKAEVAGTINRYLRARWVVPGGASVRFELVAGRL